MYYGGTWTLAFDGSVSVSILYGLGAAMTTVRLHAHTYAPGRPVAHNLGLPCLNSALPWAIVAYFLRYLPLQAGVINGSTLLQTNMEREKRPLKAVTVVYKRPRCQVPCLFG